MEEDDYYLKWEKHHNAFVSVFDYLYQQNILVDCTLAAEEKYIKAHRIVLMACSPYLQKILCEHSDNYPIVFFDIKYSDLEAIVNFCYRGEVKIPFNELEGFIEAATMLQIKGLCRSGESEVLSDSGEKNKRRLSFSGSAFKKKRRISNNNEDDNREDEIIGVSDTEEEKDGRNGYSSHPLAMVSVKSEPDDLLNLARDIQGSDNSDVDSDDTGGSSGPEGEDIRQINEFLSSSSTLLFPWTCNRCGEAFATRAPYEEHRRNCSRIDPLNHPWKCHKCPNAYKNKKDLVRHLIYCGNDTPRLYCNRCGNSYKYERGLKRHQKYCGTDVKPLKCPQCEKTYKYKRGLRRHQRRCGIAEALQFLAGKGVTPVVVTKRALGMPSLVGDITKGTLPMLTSANPQMTISLKPQEDSSFGGIIGEASGAITSSLVAEASVCHCGKVYKYKKSYDKHIASCTCTTPQQVIDQSINKTNNQESENDESEESEEDEEEDEDEENYKMEETINGKEVEEESNEVLESKQLTEGDQMREAEESEEEEAEADDERGELEDVYEKVHQKQDVHQEREEGEVLQDEKPTDVSANSSSPKQG